MIRLAVIGTRSSGKSSIAKALAIPEVETVDGPSTDRINADAYLLVCDKDLISSDYEQIVRIVRAHRPVGVVLNKADTYSRPQLRVLLQHIRRRLTDLVPAGRLVPCAADPVRIVWRQRSDGTLVERHEPADRDIASVIMLANQLVADAANSLRVRARTFAAQLPLAFRPK